MNPTNPTSDGLWPDSADKLGEWWARRTAELLSNDRTSFAQALAWWMHRGQVDKNGEPYINHLHRVAIRAWLANQAGLANCDIEATAWLHDIVEDTWMDVPTLARLLGPGSEPVQRAVYLITRWPGQTWRIYIEKCGIDPIARVVKIADLKDNLDPRRQALWRARDPEAADRHERMARKALEWLS